MSINIERVFMELADKILQLRKDKGWTQAIAAKHIAIQQSYLSKLESGQYQPSAEVIDKLCDAYQIPTNMLCTESKKQTSIKLGIYSLGLISLMLILSGYFALIFPQTYYTYKTVPLHTTTEKMQTSYYHVTDEYIGDNYVQMINGLQYEYSLITARDISRKENRWLITIGFIILLSSLTLLANRLTKWHATKS